MAAKPEAKQQETEATELQPLQVEVGEFDFTPGMAGKALSELLVARLTHLGTSELLADATACGVAVKAAFDQIEKADDGQ
ncbi:hypothetical protein HBO43_22350 [Pseudomonas veronii]|uniref:Uncharacterized protein n=1 Tax=Pseudomonas veronii TaxID=76761 RepID=A0A7Y1F4K9_PSEVE|nr:hypothetical protein [Pseudomonas veronii]NMX99335.1 hypothetical protein [Pseudomonas veronii]